jgi:hypothetical protein
MAHWMAWQRNPNCRHGDAGRLEGLSINMRSPGGRTAVAASRDAVELLESSALNRLKRCPGSADCGWPFLDAAENASRRWCSMVGWATAQKRAVTFAKSALAGPACLDVCHQEVIRANISACRGSLEVRNAYTSCREFSSRGRGSIQLVVSPIVRSDPRISRSLLQTASCW